MDYRVTDKTQADINKFSLCHTYSHITFIFITEYSKLSITTLFQPITYFRTTYLYIYIIAHSSRTTEIDKHYICIVSKLLLDNKNLAIGIVDTVVTDTSEDRPF